MSQFTVFGLLSARGKIIVKQVYQALTTPGKIRLPIGQPAGKYQVAPMKSQVAPLFPKVFINNTVYDDFVTHSKIKCNINGIRSVENNEKKLYFEKKR